MTSFKGCHPYSNVPSLSRHEQRLVRQPNLHHSKTSGPSLPAKTQSRPATPLHRNCNRETHEIHEKKSAFIHPLLPNLRIQQEVTEKTEDRVRSRSLRCLLFKPLGVARRRTPELSDAGGPARRDRQPTWPARIRSSDFVRHHSVNS